MKRPAARRALGMVLAAVLAWPLGTLAQAPGPSAPGPATPSAAASAAWRQQFDDPVLTALLAPLAAQDGERAQALARQWVAVRVFHAQWSAFNALSQLVQDQQAALMDLPPGTADRDARLARVAAQLDQVRRLTTERASRRDDAIDAVARPAGTTPQALVARIGEPLTEWRLPHLVAEPPTMRLTVAPGTSTLAQRLSDLHACHEAALRADRAALAARQRLAQAPTPNQTQAWQDLLLALGTQAGAAGDLALAWLDYLAVAPAAAPSGASHGSHAGSRAATRPV